MDLLEAIFLGVLQGATEFLPVSSSGHLRLAQSLMGAEEPDLLFDVVLHVGTLLAVMALYRSDLVRMGADLIDGIKEAVGGGGLRAALRPKGVRLALLIVIATVPTGLLGLLLSDVVDSPFFTLPIVGGLLLVNGAMLLSSRLAPTAKGAEDATSPGEGEAVEDREATLEDDPEPDPFASEGTAWKLWNIGIAAALIIGVAQGMAVLPGISRSGLTITAALFLSVQRQEAARFSFLLSIPAILGALVLELKDASGMEAGADQLLPYLAGAVAAFSVGYGCLVLLMRMLRRAQFHHFAWYCFVIGAVAIGYTFFAAA